MEQINMPEAATDALERAQEFVSGDAMETLRAGADTVRSASKTVLNTTEEFIRENPMYALLGAAALGLAIGYLVRRPSVEYKV